MTFYEFQLRSIGYRRKEQFDWAKFRRVAFAALWGFNSDPKKLPKTESKYLSLPLVDGDAKEATSKQVNAFKKAMSQYVAKQKLKNG